jgi:hypothetical protein
MLYDFNRTSAFLFVRMIVLEEQSFSVSNDAGSWVELVEWLRGCRFRKRCPAEWRLSTNHSIIALDDRNCPLFVRTLYTASSRDRDLKPKLWVCVIS